VLSRPFSYKQILGIDNNFEKYVVAHSVTVGKMFIVCCAVACRLSKVRGSWFLEATDFWHPQARQIHRCIFAPVTSVNAHYYSVLTTPFDMVNAHYALLIFAPNFSLRFKIRQVTQVARFRLSQALPSCYARSLASDLGKSTSLATNDEQSLIKTFA
jgi:hypothetical protein